MMKAAFFSYDLEKTVWDQDSGTNLPFFHTDKERRGGHFT